jgi:Ca2+/Na+ antiporter
MNRVENVVNYVIFALGIFTLASTVFGVWQHFSPLPIRDSWDGAINFYIHALQTPWRAFFAQHNEHRLAFSHLIFFADVRYFGARNVLSLIANLVLAGLLATTFYRITLHYQAALSRSARFGLAGGVLVFAFSWIQNENFTWGFQNQWFAVYLFALLAFHSIERTAEATADNERIKSRGWFGAAMVSAWAAAYSMSSGVLVFPVLFIQAIYLRLRPRDLLVIVGISVAVWYAYFIDWVNPAGGGSLTTSLREHPLAVFHYMLLYLGAPAFYGKLGSRGADACGAFALVVLLAGCIYAIRHREKHPRAIAMLAFSVFIAGNALLTASGRLALGIELALTSRYTTASLAGWLALILFVSLNADSVRHVKRAALVAVFAILIIASYQPVALKSDHDLAYTRLVAGLALRAHVYDPGITNAVYPFAGQLTALSKATEAARLSIFAPNQPDYLVPPDHVNATALCAGYTDVLATTMTPGVYRASGWIYDMAGSQTARAIVVTDAAGRTLGTGVTGGKRDDVRKLYGGQARYTGWTAFFRAPSTGDIRIYGQIAGNAYCSLQNESAIPKVLAPSHS